MDEVSADKELRATICKRADAVSVPDFLEEVFSHDTKEAVVGGGEGNCGDRPGLSKPDAT
jgi:hypothetical protein